MEACGLSIKLRESAHHPKVFFFSSYRARSRLQRSWKRLVVDQLFSHYSRTGEKQKVRCLPESKQNKPQTKTQTKQKTHQRKDTQKTKWNTTFSENTILITLSAHHDKGKSWGKGKGKGKAKIPSRKLFFFGWMLHGPTSPSGRLPFCQLQQGVFFFCSMLLRCDLLAKKVPGRIWSSRWIERNLWDLGVSFHLTRRCQLTVWGTGYLHPPLHSPGDCFFFFSLHCRTSARHCRSTTGMSEERKQISPKAKANKNKHTKQTKQHPQKAKPGKNPGKFASKVKQVKRPRPSQAPHKFSSAK